MESVITVLIFLAVISLSIYLTYYSADTSSSSFLLKQAVSPLHSFIGGSRLSQSHGRTCPVPRRNLTDNAHAKHAQNFKIPKSRLVLGRGMGYNEIVVPCQ